MEVDADSLTKNRHKKWHLKKDARYAGKTPKGFPYTFPTISNSD
ncbi:hypothetical protein [Anabaena sp. UHCC 0399]|nr:hypothetical protein [Anabaena sp. UHCC 0399]MEA5565248.1 hypothetical protein [Anabaena sp. UHCC 0399]